MKQKAGRIGRKKAPIKRFSPKEELFEEYISRSIQKDRCVGTYKELVAKRLGLQASDVTCLEFIQERGRARAHDLVEITGFSASGVATLIARIENKGYVTYRRSRRDRREVVLEPVPEKMAEFTRYYRVIRRKLTVLVSSYGGRELALLAGYKDAAAAIFETEIEKLRERNGDGHAV